MSDITTFKKYAIYRIGTGTGVPTVATGVNSTATTITSTVPFVDQDGVAIAEEMLVSAKLTIGDHKGEIEVFRVPAGGVSADGMTFTNCVRGIEPGGLDEAGNADFALDLPEGTILGIAVSSLQFTAICDVIKGTLPTGANALKIGDGTAADITITAHNNDASKPFVRYDDSDAKWIYSNNGVDTLDVGGGTGTITSGDGIEINTGVVAVDLDTNPGLEFNSGDLRAKVKASGGITRDADGLSIDQANVKIAENVAVTATSTEINQALDGISANVTAANLGTLTGAGNADALHTHLFNKKIAIKVSPVEVTGTTTETAIVAATSIPAGTLGTTQGVRVRVNISALSYATGTLTLRFKYGSTTVISSVLAPLAGTIGTLEYRLYADASATAQIAFGKIFLSTEELTASSAANQVITHPTGTASEASAGALNVTVTAQWSSANAGNSVTCHSAEIETIQA